MNRREMRLRKNKVSRPKTKFWTIKGKTIWDVFQLLIIPLVLSVIALSFYYSQNRRNESLEATRIAEQRSVEATRIVEQRSIEANRANQELLRNYYDAMTGLLLEENLRSSAEGSEVRTVARSFTLSVLRSLDAERKSSVVRFLIEANLVQSEDQTWPIIYLTGADLHGADLSEAYLLRTVLRVANLSGASLTGAELSEAHLNGANLSDADLREAYLGGADLVDADLRLADLSGAYLVGAFLGDANLSGAILYKANLSEADLRLADLYEADLSEAVLYGANLNKADLYGANLAGADLTWAAVTKEQLAQAKTLEGATMPDGKVYDPAIHTEIVRLRKEAGREP